ncbi:VanZ family protein [Bacillus sp. SG-1]|uniref:VanZ family protein n=1 Tax=Bacillus sp. SG-1 TaxID=161544 RepID=UPI000694C0B3|nr:VanZ family protein [Bacillus sp. SG-1]
MRLLVVFLYLSLLFVMACTASLTDLIEHQQIRFSVDAKPDFYSFFEFRSFNYTHPLYITQKSGHAISFFMLAVLLMALYNSLKAVIYVTWSFAFLTEIAQLFFSRTGCLVDVLIDLFGVMLFLIVYFTSRLVAGLVLIR